MKPDLERIVKDVLLLTKSIDSRWRRNRATWGIAGDAEYIRRTADVAALRRCIEFVLDAPPADGVAGYKAAQRLDAVLRTVERHRAEIQAQLNAA